MESIMGEINIEVTAMKINKEYKELMKTIDDDETVMRMLMLAYEPVCGMKPFERFLTDFYKG